MGIFKRRIKFVSAICPECKGNLELDGNLETAFCQHCGAQCIVENARKKTKRRNNLETVLDFIERQQSLRRQDKLEKRKRAEEEERKNQDHLKKFWWVYTLIFVSLLVFVGVMAILEN